MDFKIEKIKELVFDEMLSLGVIKKNPDLLKMFLDETDLSLNVVLKLSKESNLPEKLSQIIRDLFDNIILTKIDLVNSYLQIANEAKKNVEITQENEIKVDKKPVEKKEKLLPRRYGREKILVDIEKQNGKATNAQLTALEINDLKNLWVNLSSKMIKEMLSGTQTLTDEDYRVIRSTIGILKTKINPILKKK